MMIGNDRDSPHHHQRYEDLVHGYSAGAAGGLWMNCTTSLVMVIRALAASLVAVSASRVATAASRCIVGYNLQGLPQASPRRSPQSRPRAPQLKTARAWQAKAPSSPAPNRPRSCASQNAMVRNLSEVARAHYILG